MKKYILFLVILIFIGIIITIVSDTFFSTHFWRGENTWICQNKEWVKRGQPSTPRPEALCGESDESRDDLSLFLIILENETKIGFSDIQDIEFNWVLQVKPERREITVNGKGFEAVRVSEQKYQKAISFLKNRGFAIDIPNIADGAGTVGGLIGYKKDNIVCTIAAGFTGYKEAQEQWIPPETDKYDIEIKCGQYEALTAKQAISITQNSECTEKASLTDAYIYNKDTKTWWIDLEMKQEFKKELCNPACVVNENTKTAEINWRCMGATN